MASPKPKGDNVPLPKNTTAAKAAAEAVFDKTKPSAEAKPAEGGDKAENPVAVAGHNQGLTEDQQAALFFNHLKLYRAALETKKLADAALKNACKLMKAEGTKLDDIKTAIQLQDNKDGEKEVRAQIEDTIRVAKWMGYSVGHQVDMFPDRRPAAEKAFDDGKVSGLAGLACKPPFDPGQLCDKWVSGWQTGQKALVMKLAPPKPPEQKVAAPVADQPKTAPKAPAPPKPSMAGGLEDQPTDQQKH